MGFTIFLLFVMVLLMCFCIYNWWERREKSKRMFDDEKKKINIFNTHTAWGFYSLIILLGILGYMGYQIYKLMNYIYNM
ncbi:MAG: hypothetical protein K0R50_2881 [Eubacterium sp.]|jgi:cytochrome c oxidase assembly factor CtaG|nr:hypothetical protein [Eubacterium sp.]